MINLNKNNIANEISQPIGLLDSGVGGLSVLSELYKIMPDKDYIFFGDTKNLPYGTKTKEQIFKYTKEILEFFITKNVKNVVIACNTTSATAYDELKNHFKDKLTIYPLIQSVAKDSIENLNNNDTIAVLATKATVNSKKYTSEIRKINPNINTIEIDCSGFVEIVENRLYNETTAINLIKSKLETAKQYNAKRIILGCTHYPYLINIFKKIYNTQYFNPAISIAKLIKSKIQTPPAPTPQLTFYVSKSPEEFKLSAKTFFNIKNEVKVVDFAESLV